MSPALGRWFQDSDTPQQEGGLGRPLTQRRRGEALQHRGTRILSLNLPGKRKPRHAVSPPPEGLELPGDGPRERDAELGGPGRCQGSRGGKGGG